MIDTVACVWVQGNVPYGPEYPARLAGMVRRALPGEYRVVCFTDQPDLLPEDVTPLPIRPLAGAGWWSKLHLFRPRNGLAGRVLYLDLDVLVTGDLSRLGSERAPFAIVPDNVSTFQPRDRRLRVIRRFNSSVMLFDAGVYADLWTEFSPEVPARLWGDQDWIAERHPDAVTFPLAWFPRLSTIRDGSVPHDALVVLAKKPKPAEAARLWPWVREVWCGPVVP